MIMAGQIVLPCMAAAQAVSTMRDQDQLHHGTFALGCWLQCGLFADMHCA